jgi:membrane protein required for beta-lactamase induction
MIHQEPTGAFRAGFLLVLGGSIGLVGLVLLAGRTALQAAAGPSAAGPSTAAAARLLNWGPRTLIGMGCALGVSAAAVLLAGWMQRRP